MRSWHAAGEMVIYIQNLGSYLEKRERHNKSPLPHILLCRVKHHLLQILAHYHSHNSHYRESNIYRNEENHIDVHLHRLDKTTMHSKQKSTRNATRRTRYAPQQFGGAHRHSIFIATVSPVD